MAQDALPCQEHLKLRSIVRRLCLASCDYLIWQERNGRLFKGERRSLEDIFIILNETVKLRLTSLKVKVSQAVINTEETWGIKMNVVIVCDLELGFVTFVWKRLLKELFICRVLFFPVAMWKKLYCIYKCFRRILNCVEGIQSENAPRPSEKYSRFCGGNLQPGCSATFRGRMDSGKRKLQTNETADVFQAYSDLCSRNVQRRYSVGSPQSPDVFQRYMDLCATRASATFRWSVGSVCGGDAQPVSAKSTFGHTLVADANGPPLSNPRKRTAGSLHLIPITSEASTSKRSRYSSIWGVGTSTGRSDQTPSTHPRGNIKGSTYKCVLILGSHALHMLAST
ncbi:hypothetical protein Tco_0383045 [Tanacetum coccineum]